MKRCCSNIPLCILRLPWGRKWLENHLMPGNYACQPRQETVHLYLPVICGFSPLVFDGKTCAGNWFWNNSYSFKYLFFLKTYSFIFRHYPIGLLFDLLASSSALPWNITVHFKV